jgi:hypothetical protein
MDTSLPLAATTGGIVAAAVALALVALSTVPVLWLCWRFLSMDDAAFVRANKDVLRFLELTDEARRELAATPRLPLLDPAGAAATTAAIYRFAERKEQARKAIYPHPLAPSAD